MRTQRCVETVCTVRAEGVVGGCGGCGGVVGGGWGTFFFSLHVGGEDSRLSLLASIRSLFEEQRRRKQLRERVMCSEILVCSYQCTAVATHAFSFFLSLVELRIGEKYPGETQYFLLTETYINFIFLLSQKHHLHAGATCETNARGSARHLPSSTRLPPSVY